MDRAQIVKLVRDTLRAPSPGMTPYADVEAERLVAALEERGVLRLGEPRRWRVTHDDPQAVQKYEFDVEAHSSWSACIVGARMAIRTDPKGTLGGQDLDQQRRDHLAEDEDLVGVVALMCVAVPED